MCINCPCKQFDWSAYCLIDILRIVAVPIKDMASVGWKNEAELVEVDDEVSFIDSFRTLSRTHYRERHRLRLFALDF